MTLRPTSFFVLLGSLLLLFLLSPAVPAQESLESQLTPGSAISEEESNELLNSLSDILGGKSDAATHPDLPVEEVNPAPHIPAPSKPVVILVSLILLALLSGYLFAIYLLSRSSRKHAPPKSLQTLIEQTRLQIDELEEDTELPLSQSASQLSLIFRRYLHDRKNDPSLYKTREEFLSDRKRLSALSEKAKSTLEDTFTEFANYQYAPEGSPSLQKELLAKARSTLDELDNLEKQEAARLKSSSQKQSHLIPKSFNIARLGAALCAAGLFFFPWLQVSCSERTVLTQSGIQMAAGSANPDSDLLFDLGIAEEEPEEGSDATAANYFKAGKFSVDPADIAFLVLACLFLLLGALFAFSLSLHSRFVHGSLVGAILCGLSFFALLIQLFLASPMEKQLNETLQRQLAELKEREEPELAGIGIDQLYDEAREENFETRYRPFFYAELFFLAAPGLLLLSQLLLKASNRSTQPLTLEAHD